MRKRELFENKCQKRARGNLQDAIRLVLTVNAKVIEYPIECNFCKATDEHINHLIN